MSWWLRVGLRRQSVLDFTRAFLADQEGYRWRLDGVEHLASRARVKVISSDSTAGNGPRSECEACNVCDEPGSWAPQSGRRRLWDAVSTVRWGKRKMTDCCNRDAEHRRRLTGSGQSWWPATVAAGSGDSTHVALLQADPDRWESFDEVLRVNPVASVNPHLRRALEREHKSALESPIGPLEPFGQFRLNIPGEKVDSQPLITSAEWERICTKPIPEISGKPVIGLDLGGTRSWSAACALWPSGRIESWALAPGFPLLSDQEKEDQVAPDSYSELVRSGGLAVDEGQHVPSIERLLARIWAWEPLAIVCDNYRAPELHQVVSGRTPRVIERARSPEAKLRETSKALRSAASRF